MALGAHGFGLLMVAGVPLGVRSPQVPRGGMRGVGGVPRLAREVRPIGRRRFASASGLATAAVSYD